MKARKNVAKITKNVAKITKKVLTHKENCGTISFKFNDRGAVSQE